MSSVVVSTPALSLLGNAYDGQEKIAFDSCLLALRLRKVPLSDTSLHKKLKKLRGKMGRTEVFKDEVR